MKAKYTYYRIDFGIRIPKITRGDGKPEKEAWGVKNMRYPWKFMRIGDSFFVPGMHITRMGERICQRHKVSPDHYTSRTTRVNGMWGTRVWRTE